jgi:hypothetical protein
MILCVASSLLCRHYNLLSYHCPLLGVRIHAVQGYQSMVIKVNGLAILLNVALQELAALSKMLSLTLEHKDSIVHIRGDPPSRDMGSGSRLRS